MLGYAAALWRRLSARLKRRWGRPAAQASIERRQTPRHRSVARVTWRPAVAGDALSQAAQVHNVSCGGISLLVGGPVEPGTLLHVELAGAARGQPSLLACVRHVTRAEAGTWSLGCSFLRDLSEEELQRFL
jgi:hypothetical protein